MPIKAKIAPCLWFDTQAEEAAKFYVSVFPDSGIDAVSRYGKEGFEVHGRQEGSALTVAFRLGGLPFTALNGGPQFKFTEAVSLQVFCDTQDELDHFWNKLSEGGEEGVCGWLKDRFGFSWQIVPSVLPELLRGPDTSKSEGVMRALMKMKKLDIATLERASRGQ
jgi:predicted 3-demethylubiquinone-9 3-methyltransferase (glyoxalase superfamily)